MFMKLPRCHAAFGRLARVGQQDDCRGGASIQKEWGMNDLLRETAPEFFGSLAAATVLAGLAWISRTIRSRRSHREEVPSIPEDQQVR
jgi:hypothetical protein